MTEAATTTATGLTPKRLYRFLAIAEAITWTLLIIAMIAKYGLQVEWLVPIAGPIHGFVFVSYAAMQLVVGHNQRWSVGTVLLGIVTAVVPYATIPWERWIDRLYRWGINHALLMAILVLVRVAIVFVVLLNAGPPTEWFD